MTDRDKRVLRNAIINAITDASDHFEDYDHDDPECEFATDIVAKVTAAFEEGVVQEIYTKG